MANESKHAAEYTIAKLQVNLQASEGIRGSVKSIATSRNQFVSFTKAEHDFKKRVSSASLRLVLDDSGATAPSAGQTLVCRGTGWIEGGERKVAVFRA